MFLHLNGWQVFPINFKSTVVIFTYKRLFLPKQTILLKVTINTVQMEIPYEYALIYEFFTVCFFLFLCAIRLFHYSMTILAAFIFIFLSWTHKLNIFPQEWQLLYFKRLPNPGVISLTGGASSLEMVTLLVQTGLFDTSLTLCQTFNLSLTPVFEGLTFK